SACADGKIAVGSSGDSFGFSDRAGGMPSGFSRLPAALGGCDRDEPPCVRGVDGEGGSSTPCAGRFPAPGADDDGFLAALAPPIRAAVRPCAGAAPVLAWRAAGGAAGD